jgi:hypothetical protein
MKTILTMISAGLLFFATSCEKNSVQDNAPAREANASAISDVNDGSSDRVGPITMLNTERAQQISVYFDATLHKVEVRPNLLGAIPVNAITPGVVPTVNTMYVFKEVVPPGTVARFIPIVNALPRTDFSASALWNVVILTHTNLQTKPIQLYSSREVENMLLLSTSGLVATNTDMYLQMQMSPLWLQPATTK